MAVKTARVRFCLVRGRVRGTRRASAILVVLAAAVAAGDARGAPTTLPEGFQEEAVLTGLIYPTTLDIAPDGRIFVAEKSGLIKVFDGFGDTTPTVFADLRTQVHNYWDRGLLGLALHPDFPHTPWVYVLYTLDAPPGAEPPFWGEPGATSDGCPTPPGPTSDGCVVQGRLSRLVAEGDVAVGEETVLVTDWCQQYPSHSIGTVAFGPDGALYVGGGDGASFNWVDYGQVGTPKNPCGDPPSGLGGEQVPPLAEGGALRAQDVRTTADPVGFDGAILRLDPVTGEALPDNPLYGGETAGDDRIVAYGLRNPFRFSFRPGTTELWIGDVGWGAWEEIDRIQDPSAGPVRNFGWPCYEGPAAQPAYAAAGLSLCQTLYGTPGAAAPPFYAWKHGKDVVPDDPCGPLDKGSAAGNVVFYTGGTWPVDLVGALFFTDYNRACIWGMRAGADGEPDPATVFTFAALSGGAVDLKRGPGGDLYWVDYTGGAIRRIRYFAENAPPVASLTATPTSGPAPLDVVLDASGSTDANPADVLTFSWDLDGDGVFGDAAGATVEETFATAGVWAPAVRVTDVAGAASVASVEVVADDTPPELTLVEPPAGTTFVVGQELPYAATGFDVQDGVLPPEAFVWTLVQLHCDDGCHEHVVQSVEGELAGIFVAPDHEYPSHLEIRVTATDSAGLSTTVGRSLLPQTTVLSFATEPSGLLLAVGDSEATAPFAREVIVGSAVSVAATSPQVLEGVTWKLAGWDDGGAPSHLVVAPGGPVTYTATFVLACGDGVVDAWESCDVDAACCVGCALATGPPCDDGDVCTWGDRCVGGACVGGGPVSCRDGNRCTDDACDPLAGCTYAMNEAACSDADACTVGDVCGEGLCVSGAPLECDDGDPCTADACRPLLGCSSHLEFGPCDDGDPCTVADMCSSVGCAGRPMTCPDGGACVAGVCVP